MDWVKWVYLCMYCIYVTVFAYFLQDAFLLRKRLSELKQQKKMSQGFIRVSVVGGGYSGVEVATTVAQTIGESPLHTHT